MAKKRSKQSLIIYSILSFIVGLIFSAITVIYMSLPESFVIPATKSFVSSELNVAAITEQDLSIHFLEPGNKYTGDCTLIKVHDTEILIDAGSRTNSVPVIKEYLDQYVTDGTIEYVIVTHAHQDHIAGFGTSTKTDSIFDLYEIGTVIQFVHTSSKSQVYKNYCRELNEVQARCGTKVYDALQCINEEGDAQKIYDLGFEIKLEILDQKYYHEDTAGNENDNSVCCQIIQNNSKYYLFTGDLESDGEESLVTLNQGRLHQVELYKAGHHGSKTSSSSTLLEIIQPKIVCVCCCAGSCEYTTNKNNQFPTQEFIDRVSLYTDQIFVTTLCIDYKTGNFESMNGNIVVFSTGNTVSVACSHSNTIVKNTDWFKANRKMPTKWLEQT